MGSSPYPTSVQVLVIVSGEKNQDAAIVAFLADAPLLEKTIREIGGVRTLEGAHSNDSDLRVGLLLDFGGKCVDLLSGRGVYNVGEVV